LRDVAPDMVVECRVALKQLDQHYQEKTKEEKLELIKAFEEMLNNFDAYAEEYYPTIKKLEELKQQILGENNG